jgi:hypothetical protein
MKILKFKTNIESKPGVAILSYFIDRYEEVVNWEVETSSKENILTVRGEVSKAKVLSAVKRAGFQIAAVG